MGQPMTDLIPLENPQPSALFAPGGLEPILSRIESDARSLVPDISTVKGRAAVASLAAKVAKAKTYLDGLGKEYTADLKRQTGAVDAERKAMRDRLDALKAEVRKPLDDWEQAEIDRVESIRGRIAYFTALWLGDQPPSFYANAIAEMGAIPVDDSFSEFQDEAQAAKEACLYRLTVARDAALHREAEAGRQAAEAEAERAKAQAEREERIAREAAERATREAEAKAQEAARQAEMKRAAEAKLQADAIAEQQRAVQDAERKAQEAESRAQREAETARARTKVAVEQEKARAEAERIAKEQTDAKRAADKAHRERIHAEIEADFRSAAPSSYAEIVEAIASGRIRHLRVDY